MIIQGSLYLPKSHFSVGTMSREILVRSPAGCSSRGFNSREAEASCSQLVNNKPTLLDVSLPTGPIGSKHTRNKAKLALCLDGVCVEWGRSFSTPKF